MQKESVTIVTFIESSIDSDSVIIRERFELAAISQAIRKVLYLCFLRIVAQKSRCRNVTSSVVFMFYRIVAKISRCKYITSMLQICFLTSVAKMSL